MKPEDILVGFFIVLAPLILGALLYDPMTENIPDDIPGSQGEE